MLLFCLQQKGQGGRVGFTQWGESGEWGEEEEETAWPGEVPKMISEGEGDSDTSTSTMPTANMERERESDLPYFLSLRRCLRLVCSLP